MKVENIPEAHAQISFAEIFLAAGNVQDARRYLEIVTKSGEEFPRASYYRGVLARLAGDPASREYFVDALLDPQLSARAAVQLVQLGELHIPSVRTALEQAAAAETRMSDVYLALTDIYFDELRRIEETVRLSQPLPDIPLPSASTPPPVPAAPWRSYAGGASMNTTYELLSQSEVQPRIQSFVAPHYPPELIQEKTTGKVIMEAQVTERGDVAGIWLVSADPEIFSSLATTAIRQWRFEPVPAKIRVIIDFKP
jgi:hypothetical protein